MKKRILVVDIGGTFVKLLMSERVEREFPSGPRMTPKQFLAKLKETVRGWKFDVASIGFPAPVRDGRILRNPKHLSKDWVHFNFARTLGIPVRIVNDAAMQALGSYLGFIHRDVCAIGIQFVCAKRSRDAKGSGDSTTA